MTADHQPRIKSAKPAHQRGYSDIAGESGSTPADPKIIASDLHVVKGDGSSDLSVHPTPALDHKSSKHIQPDYVAKRAFDVFCALFLGLLLAPLIVVIVALIRLNGKPVLFRH